MNRKSGFINPNVVWNKTIYIFISPALYSTSYFSMSSPPLPTFFLADFSMHSSFRSLLCYLTLFCCPLWRYSSIHHWTYFVMYCSFMYTPKILELHITNFIREKAQIIVELFSWKHVTFCMWSESSSNEATRVTLRPFSYFLFKLIVYRPYTFLYLLVRNYQADFIKNLLFSPISLTEPCSQALKSKKSN